VAEREHADGGRFSPAVTLATKRHSHRRGGQPSTTTSFIRRERWPRLVRPRLQAR
jgi:hypothetical protein